MNAEEATLWHIRTARNALDAMMLAMHKPGMETPVAHSVHMHDRIRLVEEHMEGLAFEYDRFWSENLDPKRENGGPVGDGGVGDPETKEEK